VKLPTLADIAALGPEEKEGAREFAARYGTGTPDLQDVRLAFLAGIAFDRDLLRAQVRREVDLLKAELGLPRDH
jgi:hypothetical protein